MKTNEDFALERGAWENPILMDVTHLLALLCYSPGASPSEEGVQQSLSNLTCLKRQGFFFTLQRAHKCNGTWFFARPNVG